MEQGRRSSEEEGCRPGDPVEPLAAPYNPAARRKADELEAIEASLLVEGIYRQYGYDYRDYARASLVRRLRHAMEAEGLTTLSALQDKVLHDPEALERLLYSLSVNSSAMFRDPVFWSTVNEKLLPMLSTYPFIRIWHAGCGSGEDLYSLTILLHEQELLGRSRIYATDPNERLLAQARDGIFALRDMRECTANYKAAGGRAAFSDYYTAQYDHVIFRPSLRQNVVFAQHNLAVDRSFNEFNLILCRGVLISFNGKLQERVHELFDSSLWVRGFLALGNKESLHFCEHESQFEQWDSRSRIYRKVR